MQQIPLDTTHVGIGNSDAHWPDDVGRSKTYVYIEDDDITPDHVFDALFEGKCVASNGPLLVCQLGDAGIGDVAVVEEGSNPTLQIEWKSSLLMSSVDIIGKDGVVLRHIGSRDLARSVVREGNSWHGTYNTTLPAFTESGYVRLVGTAGNTQAFTNPIWVKLSPPMPPEATIDFEGVPDQFLYEIGNQNLGDYYPGLFFSPDVTLLDIVRDGYNNSGYPPHSGTAVAFSYTNPYGDITFANPVRVVGAWFSAATTLYLEAYDASDNLIASSSMPSNYGSNSYMSVSVDSASIKRVRIHDTGNFWTMDDLYYSTE